MPAPDRHAKRHPSVKALLDAHPSQSDPKVIIRDLARAKVAYAKSKGWSGPPYCPKEFASIFGIRCKEVTHDIGGDGRILMGRDGRPFIEFARGKIIQRQRFTIFHEFAHTLFPDYCTFVTQHSQSREAAASEDFEFEILCDVAAAEMLFPLEDFNEDLSRLPQACFETIHDLRFRYEASIDATTYKLVELETRVPCSAIFLTDQKRHFPGDGPLWVNNSSKNDSFRDFVWPGTTPPPRSVVLDCFHKGTSSTSKVQETWDVKGKLRTWVVQAAKLPSIPGNPGYAKVAALLIPPSEE